MRSFNVLGILLVVTGCLAGACGALIDNLPSMLCGTAALSAGITTVMIGFACGVIIDEIKRK